MVFGRNTRRESEPSDFDFADGGEKIPLTPHAALPAGSGQHRPVTFALPPLSGASMLETPSRGNLPAMTPTGTSFPAHLRRNKSERTRLQGLMAFPSLKEDAGAVGSKSDMKTGVASMTWMNRLKVWMINEGGRKLFVWLWIFVHALVFGFGREWSFCVRKCHRVDQASAVVNYQIKDNLQQARDLFHVSYPIARAAALTLNVDVAFILIPICRNFITFVRRSALNHVVPFEKNITFHKFTGWSLCFFTFVHIAAHMFNFAQLAHATRTGFVGFLGANFLTGPGATGWIMTACLFLIAWYAREKARRAKFERFWYTHHLFVPFFICWQLHGMFCMIKPDRPPYCDWMQIGVFWKYWLVGGLIFLWERVLREIRSRHRTYISKVIQHPSRVCEVQIKKEKTTARAGQYVFLNCPEISFWQWHPFTLTSAPEEDYLSVHIRCVGDFTTRFAESLGCDFTRPKEKLMGYAGSTGDDGAAVIEPPTDRVLPRIMIDGPFGSASEDVFKFETVILCGGGIGVTPFASILKSIWYRLNYPQGGKPTRLQKVYFFWVCRDFDTFEWFKSLLEAIEEQDVEGRVELHTYITAKLKDDDLSNIIMSDVGGERDAVTRLRAPTHYGRPNWDRIFSSVRERHPGSDVGVFFCGPPTLASSLHLMCNKWSGGEQDDTRFMFMKENF